jgi:hypothetical protein
MANSVTKFIKMVGGRLTEVFAVMSSAGAGDADKIPALNAQGVLDPSLLNAKASSAGAGDAGKIVQLDGAGKLSSTMLPAGLGSDSLDLTTSESIVAGAWVNIHNVTGSARVRNADATTSGKEVMGFVLAPAASGATVTVYFEGTNTAVTGQTPGDVFLSTTPGVGATAAPSAAGNVVQRIGFATSATSVNMQVRDSVIIG